MIVATEKWKTPILFVHGVNRYIPRPAHPTEVAEAAESWLVEQGYATESSEGLPGEEPGKALAPDQPGESDSAEEKASPPLTVKAVKETTRGRKRV